MPNTLTTIFRTVPSTEPAEAPHPNTGVYVTGTQLADGTWQVVHTAITKTASPLTMTGRLKNFPAITASIVASGNILNIQQPAPTGVSAVGSSATSISVTANSGANATAYRFLSSSAQAGPFALLVQQAAATYNHTGLAAGAVVWYQMQYVGGGFYDDSPVSAAFSGTAALAALANDYALLVVGDSTAALTGTASAPFSPTLIPQLNNGIANNNHTGTFTSTANTALAGQGLNTNPDGTAGGMIGLFSTQAAGRYVAGKYNVFLIEGLLNTMSNEVAINGETGAATRVLALLKQYIALIRADNPNYCIITGSLTKRTNGTQPGQENQRPILNQALVDGFAAKTLDVQAVARFGQDTRLSNPGPNLDGTTNNWFVDWVHYTQQTLDNVVCPSFRDAFLFARFGIAQPLPFIAAPTTATLLPGAQRMSVFAKTATVAETAVNSAIYTVPLGGTYGTWVNSILFDAYMPATGTSRIGFQKAYIDALNGIVGLTTAAVLPTGANQYSAFSPSFYQHEDGRILVKEPSGTAVGYVASGAGLAVGEYLFLTKIGSTISLAKTSDGVAFTTVFTFAGSYPSNMYVQTSIESSLGKLYGPEGFGLTLGSLAAAAPPAATITSTRANDAALVTTGSWNKLTENGGDAFTQVFGAFGTFAFTGTKLRVFGQLGAAYGILKLTLDGGTPVLINQAVGTAGPNLLLYDFGTVAAGGHSLRVEKNVSDALYIVLNSFEVTS